MVSLIKHPEKFRQKVETLIRNGCVFQLCNGIYIVEGWHGSYRVSKEENGEWICTCLGFRQSQVCTHSAAVNAIAETRKGSFAAWLRERAGFHNEDCAFSLSAIRRKQLNR